MQIHESAVRIGVTVHSKEEVIHLAGSLLLENGYVDRSYMDAMLEREKIATTYIGNGIAIPHGTEESKEHVKIAGISVLQLPDGVDFGEGNTAYIIFGIAASNDEHLHLLSQIAIFCSEEENVQKLREVKTAQALLQLLEEVEL